MTKLKIELAKRQIDGRQRISALLLRLYEAHCRIGFSVNPADIKKTYYVDFGYLLGAAFSLWRAVFLTDVPKLRNRTETAPSIESFLKSLIRDNAINFQQDMQNSPWTVGYYLNNASMRLQTIHERHHDKIDFPNEFFPLSHQLDHRSAQDVWEQLLKISEAMSEVVLKELTVELVKNGAST